MCTKIKGISFFINYFKTKKKMRVFLKERNKSILDAELGAFKYQLEWIGESLDLNLYSEIINDKVVISITSLCFRGVCLLGTMTKEELKELDTQVKKLEVSADKNWRWSGGLYRLKLQRIEDEIERLENLQNEQGIGFDEEEVRAKLMIEYDMIEEEEEEERQGSNDDYDYWIDYYSRVCQLHNS